MPIHSIRRFHILWDLNKFILWKTESESNYPNTLGRNSRKLWMACPMVNLVPPSSTLKSPTIEDSNRNSRFLQPVSQAAPPSSPHL